MSAQAYFKTAAAELRKAVQEKRHDIDMLKRQVVEKEQSVRNYIDQLKQNQRQKESMAGSSDVGGDERAQLQRAAQHDLSEVSDAQSALSQDRQIMQRAIDNLQQEITTIEQTARELETRN